jgi:hypothetical protein
MFGVKTLTRHADLVNRMAHAVGADFGDAIAAGRLSGESLRGAVLRCTGCANPSDCARWLEAHPEGADAAPGYCRNGELFSELKAGCR